MLCVLNVRISVKNLFPKSKYICVKVSWSLFIPNFHISMFKIVRNVELANLKEKNSFRNRKRTRIRQKSRESYVNIKKTFYIFVLLLV